MTQAKAKNIQIPEYAYRFDIDTYHRLCESGILPRNLELIHGILVEKMTASPRHSYAVTRLREILSGFVPPGSHIREEKPLTIHQSEPEPDLALVAGENQDYKNDHPGSAIFVAEVSLTSLQNDRVKAAIYASAAIPEFWIVDLENEALEIYRDPADGRYSNHVVLKKEEVIQPLFAAGLSFRFSDLG